MIGFPSGGCSKKQETLSLVLFPMPEPCRGGMTDQHGKGLLSAADSVHDSGGANLISFTLFILFESIA